MKPRKWSEEKLLLEALKFESRGEFAKKSPYAYNTLLKNGLLGKACSHMKQLPTYWTTENLKEEALKHKTRHEFQKNRKAAYNAALRFGILDEICSHMVPIFTYWDFEKLLERALIYRTRREFELKDRNAYQAAARIGILNTICVHMKTPRGTSLAENHLFSIIKDVYPKAKKIRDKNVRIAGKPYIRGFDIDILVGKLGIEFDGTRWHSFEVMRNDPKKRAWSDEDIRNYHEIKDSWFASKGIQILHIKEKDWDLNEEACIKRCLEFLEVSNEHKTT